MDTAPGDIGKIQVHPGPTHVPGLRPHEGRSSDDRMYPNGWKGIAIAFMARRTFLRAGWARMPSTDVESEKLEIMVPVSYRQPAAPENICRTHSK